MPWLRYVQRWIAIEFRCSKAKKKSPLKVWSRHELKWQQHYTGSEVQCLLKAVPSCIAVTITELSTVGSSSTMRAVFLLVIYVFKGVLYILKRFYLKSMAAGNFSRVWKMVVLGGLLLFNYSAVNYGGGKTARETRLISGACEGG